VSLCLDAGSADRLYDFVDHGWAQLCETDAKGEGAGLSAICLVGGVRRREGVTAPRSNTCLPEAGDGLFVDRCYYEFSIGLPRKACEDLSDLHIRLLYSNYDCDKDL
jgi:hypothetical protein